MSSFSRPLIRTPPQRSTVPDRTPMPSIRRGFSFLIFILLFIIFLLFPSRNALKLRMYTLLTSQDTSLYSYTGTPQHESHLNLSTSTQVETSIPGSEVVTGFALLDRLYLRNGTFFIVTANRSAFPPRRNMIAPGLDMGAGHDTEPSDKVHICVDRVPFKRINYERQGTPLHRPK